MNFVYIGLQSEIHLTNWLCLENRFTTILIYTIFCLELFSSISLQVTYIYEASQAKMRDLSHMQRTKGEAINSGVSVTVEEGHSKWSSQVQRLHRSSRVLHKQYSRFSISAASWQEETWASLVCTRQLFSELQPQLNRTFMCSTQTNICQFVTEWPAMLTDHFKCLLSNSSSYEYIRIYSLHGAPQAQLGPKKHGR